MSNIIRSIAVEQGILKPEWVEEVSLVDARTITDPVAVLRICIGLAWEEWYIPQILGPTLNAIDHPDEYDVDGVYMSPDAESLSVIITLKQWANFVHEVKTTYKSVNTVGDLTNEWMWLTQIKAYCRALSTRWAMLHVLFLCGDYKYPIKPQLLCWQIEFTQEEIDDNWSLLRDYRDLKMKEAQ